MKIKELVYNDFKLTDVETSAEELVQLLRMAEEESTLSEIEASVEKLVQLLQLPEEESTLIDMEELEQVVRSGEDLTLVKRPEVVGERFKVADFVRIHKDVDFDRYTRYPFMNPEMKTLLGFTGTVVRVSDETVTVMTHPESKVYEWLKEDVSHVSHVFSKGDKVKISDYISEDYANWYKTYLPNREDYLGKVGEIKGLDLKDSSYWVEIENERLWFKGVHLELLR